MLKVSTCEHGFSQNYTCQIIFKIILRKKEDIKCERYEKKSFPISKQRRSISILDMVIMRVFMSFEICRYLSAD